MSTTVTHDRVAGEPGAPVIKRRRRTSPARMLLPVAVVAGLIAIWQLVCSVFRIPTYIIPSPVEVWASLTANWAMLMQNMWPTLIESVLGFLLGNLVAILLAVVFVHWKPAERRALRLPRCVPATAMAAACALVWRCMSATCCSAISAAATGWISLASVRR